MITCSMPAATASSTAYWMTGLSTSGSISFGCAFVTGRKRVPQPAAGKTALRTRIGPHVRGWAGIRPGPSGPGRGYTRPPSGSGGQRRLEVHDRLGERLRPVQVRDVRGTVELQAAKVRHACDEASLAEAEPRVELAVEGEDRAAVGQEPRPESLAGQAADGH